MFTSTSEVEGHPTMPFAVTLPLCVNHTVLIFRGAVPWHQDSYRVHVRMLAQDCGHSMYDGGIKHQLLEATDCMRALHDGSQCREDNLHTAVY